MNTAHTCDVFHNVNPSPDRWVFGYQAGDPLVKVATIQLPEPAREALDWCDWVYRLLSVGDDPDFGTPDEQAVAYRQRRNRSLSVGDIITFDGVAFACASMGWEQVTVRPGQIVTTSQHGTTSVDKE